MKEGPEDDGSESVDSLLRAIARAPAAAALDPLAGMTGRLLAGRYQIVRWLGAGGMGVVYEAIDTSLERPMAVKSLRALDAEALYRFKQEFRAVADLVHPNLVRLGELGVDGEQWFFTMELVEGTTLRDHVRPTGGALDTPALRAALAGMIEGLAALHGAGKVHRDVKPANMIVARDGRVVLLDFGLVADAMTRGERYGTPHYMAPEQAALGPVGPAGDLYAVGVVLYEALTGHLPFEGTSAEVLARKQLEEPPAPRTIAPEVPDDLDALCSLLLSRDPARRPRADALLTQLRGTDARAAAHVAPPFVGRAAHLEQIAAAAARSRRAPVAVVIAGESGVGKTALAERFLATLAPDALVLRGRCYEREHLPYRALDGIVDELSLHFVGKEQETVLPRVGERDAAALTALFPVLGRVPALADAAAHRAELVRADEIPARVVTALRALLRLCAEAGPLVLQVDDLQWADQPSLTLLSEIVAPPAPPPLLLLCTTRSTGSARELVPGAGDCEEVQLAGLSADESIELARRLSGGGELNEQLAAVVLDSRGHPLYLRELVLDGSRRTRDADTGQMATLEQLLWRHILAQSPEARRVLELVALAGVPLPVRCLGIASGLPVSALLTHLEKLRDQRLLRTTGDVVESYHDRVRETVTAQHADEHRPDLHLALARGLEQTEVGASRPELLAVHLAAGGDVERARRLALDAAKRATTEAAFEKAATFVQLAIRFGEHTVDERRHLFERLGDALGSAGHGREAASAYLEAAAGSERWTRLTCLQRAGENLLGSGCTQEGLRTLEEVLASCGVKLPRTIGGKLAGVAWNKLRLRLRGLDWRERRLGEEAREDLLRLDLMAALTIGLGQLDPSGAGHLSARTCRDALDLGDPSRAVRSLAVEIIFMAFGGQLAQAERTLAQMEASAAASSLGPSAPVVRFFAGAAHGYIAGAKGHYSESLARMQEAIDVGARLPGISAYVHNLTWFVVFLHQQLGKLSALRLLLDEQLRDAVRRQDDFLATLLPRIAPLAWLAADDADGLLRTLAAHPAAADEGTAGWLDAFARSAVLFYRGDVRSEAAALLGSCDALLRSLLRFHPLFAGQALTLKARLLLAVSPGEGAALREADRLAARLEAIGFREQGVCARLIRATAAAQRGRCATALQALDDAARIADEAELVVWAAAARRRLGELTPSGAGRALVAHADEEIRARGGSRPDRIAACLVPDLRDTR